MKFRCNYCPTVFPNFKLLVDHYESKHRGKLKRYDIGNKALKQVALVYGSKPEEACLGLGWNIKGCKVKKVPR